MHNFLERTWTEYFTHKKQLEQAGIAVVLVDMIGQPIYDAQDPSSDLFFSNRYPPGSYFVLYCRTGCSLSLSSGKKLAQELPQYTIVSISGGRSLYEIEYDNYFSLDSDN